MQNKKNSKKKTSSLEYTVKEPTQLLQFLLNVMSDRSRNSVKSILSRGQVTVGGHIETKYNYDLQPGQTVTILKNKAAITEKVFIGMSILHEDEDIIIIHKDAGLLSIATQKEKLRTAHRQLMDYVRQANSSNRIFVVHRLDKDTSGVMMFAKSEQVKRTLQDNWKEKVKKRTYVALVEGKVAKQKGDITSWLKESSTHMMYSSRKKNDGLEAITHYQMIQQNSKYSLLEVQLETGRKNQIRVHMQDLGHPIVGDKKYGAKANEIGRLGLHANVLQFIHPTTGKLLRFEADVPKSFIIKSKNNGE